MNLFKRFNGNDFLFFLGVCLLGGGIGMISIPWALVTVGAIFVAIGLLGALRSR